MEILAIIPARGGSKGIPQKNIKKLLGKPLIGYSIEYAKKSRYVNRVIVSTDNKKIATVAKKFGAEIPFYRPKKISGDNASTLSVIKHTLNFLEKTESYVPDIVIILQPTSPLRNKLLLEKAVNKLKRNKSDIVLEITKIKTHPYRSFWSETNYLKPFRKDFLKFHQRQQFPDCFFPTGDIYVFWTKNIKKFGNIYGPKIQGILKPEDEPVIDINNNFDFFMAEMKMKFWKNYKKN